MKGRVGAPRAALVDECDVACREARHIVCRLRQSRRDRDGNFSVETGKRRKPVDRLLDGRESRNRGRLRQRRLDIGSDSVRLRAVIATLDRSAPRTRPRDGKKCVSPSPESGAGSPNARTNSRIIADDGGRVRRSPKMVRTISSKVSQQPGMRRPGLAVMRDERAASPPSCSARTSGSAARSNSARIRVMICGSASSLPTRRSTRNRPSSTRATWIAPFAPSTSIVRR